MSNHDELLDLLLEVQTLDRVPRFGYLIRGVERPESVAEHSWQVLFLVWLLAARIAEVNRDHAIDIAMIHDLAEIRIGDLPRTASRYLPEGAKETAEVAAMKEILSPLSADTHDLLAEYHAAQTAEARLVKACDKLQLMIKVAVYESWGAKGLEGFWDNPSNFDDGGFPEVEQLFESLKARRARGNLAPA